MKDCRKQSAGNNRLSTGGATTRKVLTLGPSEETSLPSDVHRAASDEYPLAAGQGHEPLQDKESLAADSSSTRRAHIKEQRDREAS